MNVPKYILRTQDEAFQKAFALALQEPQGAPVVFHAWGIGGVGKSTLLSKIEEIHQENALLAKVSFGLDIGIDTPLELMKTLYDRLSVPGLLRKDLLDWNDPFTSLYTTYYEAIHKLETEPIPGKAVDAEPISLLKRLIKGGGELGQWFAPKAVTEPIAKGGELAVDAAAMLLSEKDRVMAFLRQHKATKKDKKLQELLINPLPKLTRAFVDGLRWKADALKQPVALLFDTYEKAPLDIDTWLWQVLIANSDLQAHPIQVVIAGRRLVCVTEGWRKLQQDRDLIYEQDLSRFDREQTAEYVRAIGITDDDIIDRIYQITKGLPYYLNWIRREQARGRTPDFSHGTQEIATLLLQEFTNEQKQIVYKAACCRWFDRPIIRVLFNDEQQKSDKTSGDAQDWFEWLTQRSFVEFVQGCYRFDDVARDVLRRVLWQDDRTQFQQTHKTLAAYFENEANRIVPPGRPAPEYYKNSEWRGCIAESLYYAIYSDIPDAQSRFISHLFASHYLDYTDIVIMPFFSLFSEQDESGCYFLSEQLDTFLNSVWPVVIENEYLESNPEDKEYMPFVRIARQYCFRYLDDLDGLAKFAAILCKARWVPLQEQEVLLQQANALAQSVMADSDPDFSADLFLWGIGRTCYILQHYTKAAEACKQATRIQPELGEAWFRLGLVYGILNEPEQEIEAYQQAIHVQPDYAEAWYSLGVVYGELNNLEQAIEAYQQAVRVQPDYAEAWYNLGVTCRKLGKLEKTIKAYQQAVRVQPDYVAAWSLLGVAYEEQGNLDQALEAYQQAVRVQPELGEVWSALGAIYGQKGNRERAIEALRQAVRVQPDYAVAWYLLGVIYGGQENWDKAIEALQQAVHVQPELADVWYALGLAYGQLCNWEQAIEALQQAVHVQPELADVWYALGLAYGQLCNWEQAIKALQQAEHIWPDKAEVWHDLGVIYGELGNWEQASEALQQAVHVQPDYAEAWSNLGVAYGELGNWEQAIVAYQQAVHVQPDYAVAWSNLGMANIHQKVYPDALACFEKVLKIEPSNNNAIYNIACYYALQKDVTQAISFLQQAIDLNPKYRQDAKTDSDFDAIRDDPRFQALMEGSSSSSSPPATPEP